MNDAASRQALDGIRVLDLSWGVAGPLGVLLLAEHGADVVKVEPPGGDPFRAYEGYRAWNRSRRSVVLDLKDVAQRKRFLDLAGTADVIVEAFRPGVLDRLGVGWDVLKERHPRLILVSCPPYPSRHRLASRPGFDALVQASGGQMWEQPGWRNGPIFLHMPMPSMGAAFLVASGALAALSAREITGRGQHVETSLFQGVLAFTTQIWQEVEHASAAYHEMMAKAYPPGIHQQMAFECAEGQWIHLSVMSGVTPTASVDDVLGLDAPDPLTAMGLSAQEQRALAERRRERFREWNRDELVEALRAHNHAAEAIVSPERIFDHPQTIANELSVTLDDPDVGSTTQVGVPIHLLGTPGAVRGPQPRVGAHTEAVLSAMPASAAPPPSSPTAGDLPFALGDVRVLDFGQYLAGPFGPMLLADLGADVVKIEPTTGDGMRMAGKPFVGCQRGKRSVALDLKSPAGLDAARTLVATADVVHHNMTRGVATRLGIDYAACREIRADIVYCNTYAYGLPDPLGRFGGLDPLYQASSGIEHEAGAAHTGNAPLYYRFGMCDTSNALLSAVGVLLALVHRKRTGEGQELWTSLHDGGLFFSSDVWLDAGGDPWPRPRLDADLMGLSPTYRLYRTQDDGWICVAAVRPGDFEGLCRVVGQPDLAEGDHDAAAVTAALTAAFATRTALHWNRALDEAGVPNEIPLDTLDGRRVFHDDDNVGLGLVAEYPHPVLGTIRQFGTLVSFSDTPGRIAGPPPLVGQHTREVLLEAGLCDGDVDALVASGAAYEPDDTYRSRFSN